MKLSAKTKMCLIIGNPVEHSLSPAMHNAAYKALKIDDRFVYLGSRVQVENVKTVIAAMRIMDNFHGLTCTIPHKIEVMKYLDEIDSIAKKIGSVNTVVKINGILKGFNTDWLGVIIPLEKITTLLNKKVLVLGAGGAARAVVYGLIIRGSRITIVNRTREKAIELAKEFNCEYGNLDDLNIEDFDIIINTTSVGMKPLEKQIPIKTKNISKKHIVFDIVYVPLETKLLKEAKKGGAKIIHGLEMLLHQGTAQFEIYTGCKAPEEVMRKVLNEN